MDFGVAMALNTFELAQVFRMRRIRPGEHLQLTIELRYPLVVDSETVSKGYGPKGNRPGLLVT